MSFSLLKDEACRCLVVQQNKIWILPSDNCLARPYTTKQQSETEHIIGQKIIICFLNSSHHNRTEIIISFLYSSHHNRTEIIICFRNSSHHNRTEIIICKTHHNLLHCCCDGFLEFCWLLADMLARGVASAGPKLTQIYSIKFLQLLYAHYECCALSVSVHYVLGGCTLRRNAFHIFYFITLINFMIMLLTLWLFFIQIVIS